MKVLDDITILVAEDERPVRMLLRVVLESAGARVIEADNGATALRLLDLHPEVDVLCTDVNMPRLNGEQLVRAARAVRADLPVVACSAMDLDASWPALVPDVDAIVQKPFVPGDLIRAIDTARALRARHAAAAT